MKNVLFYLLLTGLMLISSCGEKVSKAKIETEYGNIVVELFNDTPLHRDNFIKLAKEGYYNDLLFHRVIHDFMIQGGDPQSKNAPMEKGLGAGGPDYTIPAEIKHLHYRGVLAAARRGGPANPNKESSGSQFYIVQGKQQLEESELARASQYHNFYYTPEEKAEYLKNGGYPSLDNNYTVFGKVIEGMDVVDKIAAVQTNQMDRPLKDLKMVVRIIK